MDDMEREKILEQKFIKCYLINNLKQHVIIRNKIKKCCFNFDEVYQSLIHSALSGNIEEVDRIFKEFDIFPYFQAIFWKEIYRLAKNEETS